MFLLEIGLCFVFLNLCSCWICVLVFVFLSSVFCVLVVFVLVVLGSGSGSRFFLKKIYGHVIFCFKFFYLVKINKLIF